ncbi:MAG: hypothetical protein Q9187_000722 [Circinaria calcarea]
MRKPVENQEVNVNPIGQATQNARQSLEYGTKIVGGVTPGKDGEHLGLPVLPTVRAVSDNLLLISEAKEQLKPDATAVYVAAHQAAAAIEEALEAEIPLIVAVAEHIPLHDLLRIHSMHRSQSRSRLVGANCPGIINPRESCRIGFQPLSCFSAGSVGIVAKSGTLSYETVASTTRAGIGQSLVIGMGGDVVAGTNFVDALEVFEHHGATKGIIIIGEIGGRAEEEAADWIKTYRSRISKPKPIMALVAGVQAPPGRVMGHAGACVAPGERDAKQKARVLQDAGVFITNHPAEFGEGMKHLLKRHDRGLTYKPVTSRNRALHTSTWRPTIPYRSNSGIFKGCGLHIRHSQALEMIRSVGLPTADGGITSDGQILLAVTVDRSSYCPCIVARTSSDEDPWLGASHFPFTIGQLPSNWIPSIATRLGLAEPTHEDFTSLSKTIHGLVRIFEDKEALLLETRLSRDVQDKLIISKAEFWFDDAAYKIARRQQDIHALRKFSEEVAEEVEAERSGIVYVKLPGDGKIVNGAGLAMNTIDAVHDLGGKCANFLDTGGKATSETVKESFRITLMDPRVKTIFVNIFGGLTLCDMIAEGIILAYKDLEIKLPVVVRLRGVNEKIGQKMVTDSGLPLHSYDDFEEAARKAIALAEAS